MCKGIKKERKKREEDSYHLKVHNDGVGNNVNMQAIVHHNEIIWKNLTSPSH